MAGPVWVRWLLTVLFLGIAAYCVLRLAAARRVRAGYPSCDRATDTAQFVMSTGMAVMCSPVGGPLAPVSWQTVFCLLGVWSATGWRGAGRARPGCGGTVRAGAGHYAVASAAMVYMLAAGSHDVREMAGPWVVHNSGGGLALPVLAWAFAGYFALSALWTVARFPVGTMGDTRLPLVLGTPRLASVCHLAMAGGMGYMLLAMR